MVTPGPPSILVDEAYTIVHLSESAGRFLLPPKGPLSADLLKLVRPELQMEVRSALFRAFEKDKAVVSQPVPVQFNGRPHPVVISVRPYHKAPGEHVHLPNRQALVVFLEDESEGEAALQRTQTQVDERDKSQAEALVVQLETEVRRLREQLQGTIEEHDSSNEEMKAANEELQSINEEYRSATEELETSKEELQSVNEELQTINAEMKNKLEEISRANSDLENLMSATEIATLFLDRDLRIQRFTPDVQGLFNIMSTDRGRPIMHLTHKLTYPQLAEDAQNVLRNLTPIKREVRGQNGDYYLVRQRPYRTIDDRIDGVVITFIDISELKLAQHALGELNNKLEIRVAERTAELGQSNQKLTQANELFSALFNANPVPSALIDVEQNLLNDVNLAFLRYFNLEREAVIGRPAEDFGLGLEPGSRAHRELMAEVPKEGNALANEVQIRLPSGETRTILRSTQYIDLDGIRTFITTFIDITERKLAEEYLRALLDAAPDPTIVVDKKGRIVFVNEQVESSFGYLRKELINTNVEKLIPERFHAIHPLHRAGYFTDPRIRPMGIGLDLFALRKDGSEFPVEISLSPLENESGTLVIASIRDITERAQAEGKIRALASSLMVAEQEERQRIAQILHDDLQQRLFAIKMQLPYLSEAVEKQDQQTFRTNFEQVQTWLSEAIGTTRSLSKDISPLILQKEGFVEALHWLATQMKEMHNLDVTLDVNGVRPAFDPNLGTELFQAVRELLFNVVKHAGTRKATVSLEKLDKNIRITVKDSGKGFDAETLKHDWQKSHGLLNIHQRLSLLGCRLEILSAPKDGTRIVIDVPA